MGNITNSELKTFEGGSIHIEVQGNMLSQATGTIVNGIVHVNLMQPVFDSHNLTIGLYGTEDVHFKIKTSTGSGKNRRTKITTYDDHEVIVGSVYPLFNFLDGPPRPG